MRSFVVSGTPESLDKVTQYVLETADEIGLPTKKAYGLRLAVDEIATNIVTHGYAAAGRQGDLVFSARVTPQEVHIFLEDTGITFDPRRACTIDSNLPSPAEQLLDNSLGIFLALNHVDDFSYEHKQGVNRSTFVVKRPSTINHQSIS